MSALGACSGATDAVAVVDGFVPISRIQGSGPRSPLVDQDVTIRGIVTGDFQDDDGDVSSNLGGFFVQDERPDDDPSTSDGVFVFDESAARDVRVGDRVEVDGEVAEFFGETQVLARDVRVVGEGTVTPVELSLPSVVASRNSDEQLIADLEAFEGMLIRLSSPLVVADANELGRFGSLLLAAGDPPEQFTNASAPSVSGYAAHRERFARSTIVLDDGQRVAGVSPPRFLFDTSQDNRSLRLGDRVTYAVGNLRYSRGSGGSGVETYRLMPTQRLQFSAANPRPRSAPDVGGRLRVMSLNALNYFTTLDRGRDECGPARNFSCRGADTEEELGRQLSKLVAAIRGARADIVGLMEVENNASASVATIVSALNTAGGEWSFVDTGTIGDDAIKVALIYQGATVEAVGAPAILDDTVDARFDSNRNRPALAQAFRARDGGMLTVTVNHLKSKGSSCADLGDPNTGDGQANCNRTRLSAARALIDWLAADPTGSGDTDALIIGDLNAYREEDPVRVIVGGGYRQLVEGSAYSFVFRGERGALDHALASASLAPQVTGAAEWHINADEPMELDYNLESRDAAWFSASTPFRASDHDPVIIGLNLDPD